MHQTHTLTTLGTLTAAALTLAIAGCEPGQHQWGHVPADQDADAEPVPAHVDAEPADSAGQAQGAQPIDPEPVPYADQSQQGQTYTVREGDTYWSIAVRLYQDGQKADEIQRLNPGVDPNDLAVGQEIRVP